MGSKGLAGVGSGKAWTARQLREVSLGACAVMEIPLGLGQSGGQGTRKEAEVLPWLQKGGGAHEVGGLTSPKLMRLACFRISVSPSRSFILRYLG